MNPYAVSRYLRERASDPAQPLGDLAWQDGALCAQVDPDEWYPEKGGSILKAKTICRRCPVREPCLRYAMDSGEIHGVWGGLGHEERERFAGRYERGAGIPAIIAAADADCDARRATGIEHSRETALAAAARDRAARAARKAALHPEQSPDPQPREQAA